VRPANFDGAAVGPIDAADEMRSVDYARTAATDDGHHFAGGNLRAGMIEHARRTRCPSWKLRERSSI